MLLQRNHEFERYVRSAVTKSTLGSVAGIVLLSILGIFFLYFGIALPFIPIIIVGLIPIGGIILLVNRFKGDLKGEEYWINLLVNEPGKIVWIKPINIRHTAAYVFTLYNEMHFQLLTTEGIAVLIKCISPHDQLLFLRGVKQYIPHAHFGYNDIIQFHYKDNPRMFLHELQSNGIYQPVANLGLE